jgi:hypothetical protein
MNSKTLSIKDFDSLGLTKGEKRNIYGGTPPLPPPPKSQTGSSTSNPTFGGSPDDDGDPPIVYPLPAPPKSGDK